MRQTWDEHFMEVANLVAKRSTCLRRKVGAVLVRDNHILATGYNGAPTKIPHCKTCLREELHIPSGQRHELCRAVHAEQNIIIQCALNGTIIKGATLYCTHTPCIICAKMLVNCGISRLVCKNIYDDDEALKMLGKAHIELEGFTTLREIFPDVFLNKE